MRLILSNEPSKYSLSILTNLNLKIYQTNFIAIWQVTADVYQKIKWYLTRNYNVSQHKQIFA